MDILSAWSQITVTDAAQLLEEVLEHLQDHGLDVQQHGSLRTIAFGEGRVELRCAGDVLDIRLQAPALDVLHDLKIMVAGHLLEFAREPVELQWQGAGTAVQRPPAFRVMRVVGVRPLTPRMRRITLAGDDLARYDTCENLHCKLLIPPAGVDRPEWPTVQANGLPRLPEGDQRLQVRTYTIRRIDTAAGTLDIDMVLHDPLGPGSRWARQAKVGDVVGMTGPGGHAARPADWLLLAGDETALPAIARMLEGLPADARGAALIEVQDAAERQPLAAPPGVQVQWLLRGSAAPGSGTALADAVAALAWPQDGAEVFAWAGTEFNTFKAIRHHLREERGLTKPQHLAVSYWRLGRSEGDIPHRSRNED